ncbi:hypothetical protein PsorP6_006319 [Peronosclerospora sorghi]|uniref:Uncharacterized protein n=1 Tax=Peronosclerospora sorghi TaxID=230839 RepID=A0ACC0W3I4_9STRA|nr:hypothetical protein PsorP6_006319 [Peronosclerospora sorghi]
MELHVRACSARNLPDKQTFGKQDPFCKLTLRGKSFKTRVHDNGHKTPKWNEVFVFPVVDPQLDQLVIEVKDKNFTSSTLIGQCYLPVNMFLSGSVIDQWYPLNNGSNRAGEINLRVQYKGSDVQPPTASYVASADKAFKESNVQAYPQQLAYPPPQQPSYPPPQQPSYPPQQQPIYPPPQQSGYPPSQIYPAPNAYMAPSDNTATVTTASAPQGYPPQPYYQQQPSHPQYAQPPPQPYSQPYAPPYGQQQYYPPPPPAGPAYGYPSAAYAAGPPAGYGPPRGYGTGGNAGGKRGGGASTGQMAMGVGAGVLGGMLLGEALDDVFD